MDLPATVPRPRRPWLRSLIVLLIGLVYLGAVYWASPALREELRWEGVWYGWPWELPKRVYYRVGGDLRLKGFEKRLIAAATKTKRVRITVDVTVRSRHTGTRYDDEHPDGYEYVSPLRERRYTATLLLDREGAHESARPDLFTSARRIKLVVKGEDSWCAWVHDGNRGWYVFSARRGYGQEAVRSRLRGEVDLPLGRNELDLVTHNKMIPIWPFVCADVFDDLLRATRVSRDGEDEFDGQRCRIVRIERRWGEATREICRLWLPEGEDRIVKVEYTPTYHPDLVEALTEAELAELGTVCIVTDYEEPASFSDEDFDPVPLLERWAADTARAVEEDIEQLEAWESGIGGRFGSESEGGFGGGGFGEGFEDSFDQPDDDTPEDGQTQ